MRSLYVIILLSFVVYYTYSSTLKNIDSLAKDIRYQIVVHGASERQADCVYNHIMKNWYHLSKYDIGDTKNLDGFEILKLQMIAMFRYEAQYCMKL